MAVLGIHIHDQQCKMLCFDTSEFRSPLEPQSDAAPLHLQFAADAELNLVNGSDD